MPIRVGRGSTHGWSPCPSDGRRPVTSTPAPGPPSGPNRAPRKRSSPMSPTNGPWLVCPGDGRTGFRGSDGADIGQVVRPGRAEEIDVGGPAAVAARGRAPLREHCLVDHGPRCRCVRRVVDRLGPRSRRAGWLARSVPNDLQSPRRPRRLDRHLQRGPPSPSSCRRLRHGTPDRDRVPRWGAPRRSMHSRLVGLRNHTRRRPVVLEPRRDRSTIPSPAPRRCWGRGRRHRRNPLPTHTPHRPVAPADPRSQPADARPYAEATVDRDCPRTTRRGRLDPAQLTCGR